MGVLSKLRVGLSKAGNGLFYMFLDINFRRRRYFEDDFKTRKVDDCGRCRSTFECPSCSDIPQPPIFMCNSGHVICESCRDHLKACPTCGGGYDGLARNFLMESILETQDFPCKYHKSGCEKILQSSLLPEHEKFCIFRDVQCRILGEKCDGSWSGSILSIYAHLVISHGMTLVFRNKTAIFRAKIEPLTKRFVRLMEPFVLLKVVQGKNYIIRAGFDEETGTTYICVIALYREEETATNAEQRSYLPPTCDIRLARKPKIPTGTGDDSQNLNEELEWIGPVHSIDEDPSRILEEKSALCISWDKLLGEGTVGKNCLTWEIHINIFPCSPKFLSDPTSEDRLTLQNYFSVIPEPIRRSPWIVIAPTFTLAIMIFFVFLV